MRSRILGPAAFLLSLGACAQPATFAETQSSVPSLDPAEARIFVYRDVSGDLTSVPVWIVLDGKTLGRIEPDGVTFIDVAPGHHVMTVTSPTFGPDATREADLRAGQTAYASVETQMPDPEFTTGDATSYGPFLNFIEPMLARQILPQLCFHKSLAP